MALTSPKLVWPTLTWPRFRTMLISGGLSIPLELFGISSAGIYFKIYGMQFMGQAWPQREYTWYPRPASYLNMKHTVSLTYEHSYDNMTIAAGVPNA